MKPRPEMVREMEEIIFKRLKILTWQECRAVIIGVKKMNFHGNTARALKHKIQ